MLPILPLAMSLVEVVPWLAGKLIGKDAAKTASKVVDVAKAVTGIQDPGEAIRSVKADPELVLKLEASLIDAGIKYDAAEFADEADRRKDIRESGFLSRQVRPVIALTFHGFIWWVILTGNNAAEIAEKIGIEIFTWGSAKITIGGAYLIIIGFYFLTKGLKDYLIGKNPKGV